MIATLWKLIYIRTALWRGLKFTLFRPLSHVNGLPEEDLRWYHSIHKQTRTDIGTCNDRFSVNCHLLFEFADI